MTQSVTSIPTALRELQVCNFNAVAATTLVMYEIVITSGQEITFIWRSSWSFIKLLYLLIRYYSLVFLLVNSYVSTNLFLSEKFCRPYLLFELWGGPNGLIPVVDFLIITRIYALYDRNKMMGLFLLGIWLAECICTLPLAGIGFKATRGAVSNLLPGVLSGCQTLNPERVELVLISWGLRSAFQAAYVCLTMFKFTGFLRIAGFSTTPLLKVFFRDGVGYFLIMFAACVFNTLLERFAPIALHGSGVSWNMAIVSITASRMLLNIRRVAAPSHITTGGRMTGNDTELGVIRFRERTADSHTDDFS